MSVVLNATHATIVLQGPSDVWFGVGFNASSMADAPWTLLVDGSGAVSERQLAAPHSPGTLLTPSVTEKTPSNPKAVAALANLRAS